MTNSNMAVCRNKRTSLLKKEADREQAVLAKSYEPYCFIYNQKALRKRKVRVEPLFAEAKDWHGMRRFRLRRLRKVNCEALVIASGQNLKRLLKKRGWGRRPFPSEALGASFWQYAAPDAPPFLGK